MIRHRSGKTFPAQQRGAELADHGTKPPHIAIARQQFQRVVQAGAGLEEQRQIPGERRHLRRARPVEQPEITARGSTLSRFLDRLDRQQLKIFNTVGNLGGRRSLDRAMHDLSVLRQRSVAEIRHGLTAGL